MAKKPDTSLSGIIRGKEFYLALLLISLVAFFVYRDFLTLKKIFLYKDIGSDTLNGFYPPLKHIGDYLHTVGMPSWSFNYGMGQNMFPVFLKDPFDIFLYLAGRNNLMPGLGYLEFFKVILGGVVFFFYLKTLGIKEYTCVTGALLFSFTGFMILGGGWFMFSYEAVNAAFLLLAFEKLFRRNSWYLFPLAIAGIAMSQPFNLYIYGLFLAIYAVFRYSEENETFRIRGLSHLFGRMILLGLLGLIICSFFLFENILQYIESPRGSGQNSYYSLYSSAPLFATETLMHNVTALYRFFSSDLMGTGSDFKGWSNYLEAPVFYSGILSLLLFPQVYGVLNKRKRIIYAVFLLFWIIPVVFPYFRHAIWLFTGDYYRAFSFFVSFAVLYLTTRALNAIDQEFKINIILLFITAALLFIALSYPFFEHYKVNPVDPQVMGFVKFILVAYTVLLYLLNKENWKQFSEIAILLILCIELGYLSSLTVNRRSNVTAKELSQKVGYNDYTVDALSYIRSRDNTFYRIDKDYSSSPARFFGMNDALAQDYYGTSSYHSFNQQHYILFLQALGVAKKGSEIESRWAAGLGNRQLLESLCSVKYLLSKNPLNPGLRMTRDSLTQFGNIKVIENTLYLPMGTTYDSYMTRSDFDKLTTTQLTQMDFTLLRTFFIDDQDEGSYAGLKKFELKDTIPMRAYTWDYYKLFRRERLADTLNITDHGQTYFKGTISTGTKKLLFFSIPFDKGWHAKVDGAEKELTVVDAGLTGLLLEAGKHQVELYFSPRLRDKGGVVSLLGLGIYFLLVARSKKREKS